MRTGRRRPDSPHSHVLGRLPHACVIWGRVAAVEDSRDFPGEPQLFVRIEPCDLGTGGLAESIGDLRHLLPDGRRLVAVLPREAMHDPQQAEGLARALREMGIGVALEGFRGNATDLPLPAEGQFDFVKLAGPLVHGIQQSSDRQRLIQSAVLRRQRRRMAGDRHRNTQQRGTRRVRRIGLRTRAGAYVCSPPAGRGPSTTRCPRHRVEPLSVRAISPAEIRRARRRVYARRADRRRRIRRGLEG